VCWQTAAARTTLDAVAEYETWRLDFARDSTRGEVRRVLTEHAEYGRWELWRVRVFPDGRRRVWLRRRVVRVALTR
jgi:hypothetical protein